jgi:hypothetical protein
MSKMAELSARIDDLVEQGMSAKFIAATLNIPYHWAEDAINDRIQLEEQKRQEFLSYGDE